MLLNIVLLVFLGLILSGIGVIAFVFYRKYRYIEQVILGFITPESEGKPSPLATSLDVVAQMFARAITAQIKTTLMGLESGLVRGEKAVQGDIAVDLAGQTPLAGLLGAFPTLKKSLRRNPGLLDMALPVLASLAGKATSPGGNGSSGSPKFKL